MGSAIKEVQQDVQGATMKIMEKLPFTPLGLLVISGLCSIVGVFFWCMWGNQCAAITDNKKAVEIVDEKKVDKEMLYEMLKNQKSQMEATKQVNDRQWEEIKELRKDNRELIKRIPTR